MVAVSDQALSLLGAGPSPELIAALELRAALHLTEDEPEKARALAHDSKLAAEQLGLPQPLRTLEILAFADCLLGDVDAGMRQADDVLALLSSPGQSHSHPGIYGGLAELTLVYRGAASALGVSEQGRRLAEERHDLTSWATCRVAEMEDTFFLGRWHGLAAALDDLARTLADNDSLFSLADVQDFRLLLSLLTGTAPDDKPSAAVAGNGDALHGSLALSLLARALREAASDHDEAALDVLDRMDRHTVNFSSIPSLMLWWSLGTRLAHELGATELTVRLAGRLSASPAAPRPAAATASAILAEARGEPLTAASLYEAAASAWRGARRAVRVRPRPLRTVALSCPRGPRGGGAGSRSARGVSAVSARLRPWPAWRAGSSDRRRRTPGTEAREHDVAHGAGSTRLRSLPLNGTIQRSACRRATRSLRATSREVRRSRRSP